MRELVVTGFGGCHYCLCCQSDRVTAVIKPILAKVHLSTTRHCTTSSQRSYQGSGAAIAWLFTRGQGVCMDHPICNRASSSVQEYTLGHSSLTEICNS